jgi:hypothetical protein
MRPNNLGNSFNSELKDIVENMSLQEVVPIESFDPLDHSL